MLAEPYITLESYDLQISDVSDIAKVFAQCTKNSDVILLSGSVGAGKTEFARLVIKSKATNEKLDIEEVYSPTFSLIQTYEFQYCKISHIDLYRVDSEVDLFELGIPDNFVDQITLLEWPEILESKNLSRYICIKIREANKLEAHRDFTIEFWWYPPPDGDAWTRSLDNATMQSHTFIDSRGGTRIQLWHSFPTGYSSSANSTGGYTASYYGNTNSNYITQFHLWVI